ncbi:MAG: dihydrolipoamide acetyltransferase family protein [Chloroflexota bacterium]
MTKTFELPDLGEGLHEAEIQEVLVSVDEPVSEGDAILAVETDKASVEIPSPFTGTVAEVKVRAGDVVRVGEPVMVFRVKGETGGGQSEKPAQPEAKEAQAGRARTEKAEPVAPEEPPKAEPEAQPAESAGHERPVPASPATRRLARELGVDLVQVPAGGEHGRVTSQDVRAFAEAGGPQKKEAQPTRPGQPQADSGHDGSLLQGLAGRPPRLPDFSRWGNVERVELRSVRRAIARKMVQSWSQIPHVSHRDLADITALEQLRREEKQNMQVDSLTLTAFVMKAVVAALEQHPRFNASLDVETEELILKRYYHLGVAVDTERGLIVPVIRNVDEKSIVALSQELQALAKRTRAGEVVPEDLQGGTFTITNVGILGGVDFTPIINFPQVAILGMAQASWQLVVRRHDDGSMEAEPRYRLPLVVAFDHRVVDGADAARFLKAIIDVLEDPHKLLLRI